MNKKPNFVLQRGTPWYDGAGGVSQCAINPGETFIYRFLVDKVIDQYVCMSTHNRRSERRLDELIIAYRNNPWLQQIVEMSLIHSLQSYY